MASYSNKAGNHNFPVRASVIAVIDKFLRMTNEQTFPIATSIVVVLQNFSKATNTEIQRNINQPISNYEAI